MLSTLYGKSSRIFPKIEHRTVRTSISNGSKRSFTEAAKAPPPPEPVYKPPYWLRKPYPDALKLIEKIRHKTLDKNRKIGLKIRHYEEQVAKKQFLIEYPFHDNSYFTREVIRNGEKKLHITENKELLTVEKSAKSTSMPRL